MSAADSELSRCPDLATASIRTQSIRSTVAQRSSSAIEGASSRCGAFGGGFGSGTGLRCILTLARLAAASMGRAYAAPRTELAHRFARGSGVIDYSVCGCAWYSGAVSGPRRRRFLLAASDSSASDTHPLHGGALGPAPLRGGEHALELGEVVERPLGQHDAAEVERDRIRAPRRVDRPPRLGVDPLLEHLDRERRIAAQRGNGRLQPPAHV